MVAFIKNASGSTSTRGYIVRFLTRSLAVAVLALMALGFKQVEAHESVRQAQAVLGSRATVEELVRACLKKTN